MPDRSTFFREVSSALDFLLLHPGSETQKNITLALTLLALIFFLSKFHKWGKAVRGGFLISLAVVAVSAFFMMVAAVWGWHGIRALGLVEGQEQAALALVLGLAFFAGVAPFSRFCFKSAYFTSVAAWILSLCLAAGVIYASQWAWTKADVPVKKSTAEWQGRMAIPSRTV